MIVGVCGYGYTGSGAFLDLLKEYEELSYWKGNREFEFCLPYTTDGLLDLEYHLTKTPAKHLKGDKAIVRFKNLVKYYRRSFDRATGGAFSKLSEEYINSLIQVTYLCHNASTDGKTYKLFLELALGTIRSRLENKLHRCVKLLKERERYIAVYPDNFEEVTKQYIASIISCIEHDGNKDAFLLDQPFPPNNPEDVFHFFDNPYAIVVNRDPRDIYVIVKHFQFSPARFVPHDTVEDFVNYYKNVIRHRPDADPSRVLRLQFEDLVYEYDKTVKRIEEFLHISHHVDMKKFFDPEQSIMNTNMRDLYPEDKEAMNYIEKELPEYLYPFENYRRDIKRENLFDLASR